MLTSLASALLACFIYPNIGEFGTLKCPKSDGTIASLRSAVYDFRTATCAIDAKDVIHCQNVTVADTKVLIGLDIDLPNRRARVY